MGVVVTTDLDELREQLDREIFSAKQVMDLALERGDAEGAQQALANLAGLRQERTRIAIAANNHNIIVTATQNEDGVRKTSSARTDRLVRYAVLLGLHGDNDRTRDMYQAEYGITRSQVYIDRTELQRHTGTPEGREKAAALCDAVIRLSMAVQSDLTQHEDPLVALKAAADLTKSAATMMRLHSVGDMAKIEINLPRPFRDLPEEELSQRRADLVERIVFDIPT